MGGETLGSHATCSHATWPVPVPPWRIYLSPRLLSSTPKLNLPPPLPHFHPLSQIWDTAGQERFRTITTSYFRGAQGILLVYDVTDRRSFDSIRNWISQIQQHADVSVNKILVGNKCDITEEKVVSTAEGQKLADEYGIDFWEAR